MDISVIVPVYNGEMTLRELYDKIRKVIEGRFLYEVIFVYDCGKDNSWQIITEIANEHKDHVRGYHLDKNYGQHQATLFGFKKAMGEYIITLDEDAQHDPKYIPELIKKMVNGEYDFVYGKFIKTQQSFVKVFLSKLLRRILYIMIPKLPFEYSSYRIIRKELIKKIPESKTRVSFIDAELGRMSSNYSSLMMDHLKRVKGKSSYTLSKLFKQSLDVLFGNSSLFKVIYNTFLVFILISLIASFVLIIVFSVKILSIFIISILILSGMIFFKRESLNRIYRNFNPEIIIQLNQTK